MECPACRAPVPEGSRFCPSCGHALDARVEERRIVTVLFADLVGFTSMAEGVDPEHIRNVVDRAFQRLVADIDAHGGRVDKILGDAIVALFGAPVAHEDDGERAVRCALQMQRTLGGYTAETDVPLRMRVGINTGEVLVGALRAGGEYTAMGDTVNVASRLQVEAEPGQILVGPDTYALTQDVVRYESIGALDVRGRSEPVVAYAALEALVPPGHRPRRARTPLVGRAREMEILCAALSMGFERRRPQTVLIAGEAGIGKSRLAEELTEAAARDHGAVVLEGRCVPYGEANVWWPIAAAVRHALDVDVADTADAAKAKSRAKVAWGLRLPDDHPDVVRVSDGLLYLMGVATPLSQVDPGRARDEAVRAFIGLLSNIARRRPLVLSISELHWADQLVLDLLDRLPGHLRGLPFTIVATARPDLEDRWTPHAARHNLVILHLDPLDRAAAMSLLTTLLESEPPVALADAVLERGGGNPFYLEELAALVATSGSQGELPPTLRGLVATRLDALPAAERRVLDHAAVVGRVGSVDALSALGDGAVASLSTILDHLVDRDLLSFDGREWAFRSELVREVAYETLTKAERARHHASLGSFLSDRARTIHRESEQLEPLAHHFSVAAELVHELGPVDGVPADITDRALTWIDKALSEAERREVPAVAARLCDQALRLVGEHDDGHGGSVSRRFRVRRAKARAALRHLDEARADVSAVRKAAETAGDVWAQAAALTVQGQVEQAEGALLESAATLDEAVLQWRELADRAGEADALRLRGMTHLFLGRLASAEENIAAALSVFRELGDLRGEAWAQQNMAWIAFERGDTDEADTRVTESVRLFEEAQDWGGLAWAFGLMAWVRLQQGHMDEADRLAQTLVESSDMEGDRWARAMMLLLLANTRLWSGRTEESVRFAADSREEFEAMGDTSGGLRAIGTLARALVARGDGAEARELIATARSMAHHAGSPEAHAFGQLVAASTALAMGEASQTFDIGTLLEHPAGEMWPERQVASGLALLQFGRDEQAVNALSHVYEAATNVGLRKAAGAALAMALAVAHHPAAVERVAAETGEPGTEEAGTYLDRMFLEAARGLAAAQTGDAAGAAEHFDAAAAATAPTGDRMSQALVALARARALQALGVGDGDADAKDALRRLAAMGIGDTDWDAVFRRGAAPAG